MRESETLRRWLVTRTASERATLARLWSLDSAIEPAPELLAEAMLQPDVVKRLVAGLNPRERAALVCVQEEGGSIPAPVLEREFGAVRTHADYPNPRAYLMALEQPPTPTERLYTLALIQPAQEGPRRVYAIPPDLLALLPPVPPRDRTLRLVLAGEPPWFGEGEARRIEYRLLEVLALAQTDQLEVIPTGGLNKASLLRLAKRHDSKADLKGVWREEHWPYSKFLRQIGEGAGLLRAGADAHLRPTQAALEWMQLPALERARRLLDGWIDSSWDELVTFEGIKIQRPYSRDLPGAKRAILRLLAQAPPGQWIDLNDFVAAVKAVEPDFARPDGRYDTWSLISYRRQPLDGFEHWDAVEGRQLSLVIGGTLRWLGLTDLGMRDKEPISFRMTPIGAALLESASAPPETPAEPLVVQPNFEVVVPAYASPYARFQLERIATLAPGDGTINEQAEIYTLTKRSIQAALERDIGLDDILRFLREQSGRELPQNVVATLREWAGQHGQVSLRRGILLEAEDAAVLAQIKNDKRVRLPQVEQLTNTAWLVREGDAPAVAERLRKAGYGLTGEGDGPGLPLRDHDLTVLFAALEFYTYACAELGIEGEASVAMRQRVARLLPEKQLNRAYRASHEALRSLRERLERTE